MKFSCLLLAVVTVGPCASLTVNWTSTVDFKDVLLFNDFKQRFGRTYSNETEEVFRFKVFQQSLARVRDGNIAEDTSVFGVTKFSDRTPKEFSELLGYRKRSQQVIGYTPANGNATVASIDWRTRNAVTPVKDQGSCGSCWAFSAVEQIESDQFLAGKKLQVLSTEQVVSCDKHNGDEGCDGGDTPTAYQYVEKAGGLETESDYPYKPPVLLPHGFCHFSKDDIVASISGFKQISGGEDAMQAYVGSSGPLSVCVDASSWQDYDSGIMKKHCGKSVDHCVQVVGFDTSGTTPYWLIRNSWNTDWGEKGYLRLEMGKDLCAIASEPTHTTV